MKFFYTFILLTALLTMTIFSQNTGARKKSKVYRLAEGIEALFSHDELSFIDKSLLRKALDKSGDNRNELVKAIKTAPSTEEQQGLIFLISFMPERDLRSLSAKFLLENVKFAYKARAEFVWAKELPLKIFLNDVLPYANLSERRDNWRAGFYSRFKKKVKAARTVEEAIKLINKDLEKELGVKYSTKRKKPDQSPYESMELGLASCSGLSILLADAFRSVGIPARIAGTPSWTTVPGNHNWVEVYVDKQWKFTEYYPDKELNRSWFLERAAKADGSRWQNKIYASSFVPTESHFPMVWDLTSRDVHGVDVTQKYRQLYADQNKAVRGKELQAEVAVLAYDKEGKRIAVEFTVKDKNGDKIASAKSRSAVDDMNNMLIFKFQKSSEYTLEYKNHEGKTLVVKLKTGDGKKLQKIKLRL